MQSRADKQNSGTRPDSLAKRVASLCDMHGVPFGSAGTLGGFIAALDENKHLAMDFWAMVAKSGELDDSRAASDAMLDAIARGVTRHSAADLSKSGGEAARQVKELASLLAGEDIRRPATAAPAAKDVPTGSDRPNAFIPGTGSYRRFNVKAVPLPWLTHAETSAAKQPEPELTPERREHAASSRPVHAADAVHEIDETSASKPEPVRALDEATGADYLFSRVPPEGFTEGPPMAAIVSDLRLEPLRDRLPLESSEQVPAPELITAIEPAAVTVPDPVRSHPAEQIGGTDKPIEVAPLFVPASNEIGESIPVQAFEAKPLPPLQDYRVAKSTRLILEPERVRTVERVRTPDDRSFRVPLGEYGETGSNSRSILVAVLLVVVVGGAFLARPQISALWQDHKAAVQARHDGAAPRTGRDDGGHPAIKTESEGASAGSATAAPVARVAGERRSATLTSTGEDYSSAATAAQDVTSGAEGDDSKGRVTVFPAVMEDYLESSRVPMYPEAARANRVEGRVVMQAVIGQDGTVGHLHVVEGDPSLRNAATEAVSKWRYRPYLVDGKPVEVTTTVTVNFKLNNQ